MSLARQITCAAYSLPHVHRAAHRRNCRFRHQPLRRRRSESARSPPLCTLPLVPAGEIEGRPNQPFYDHIYFTRMAWQQSVRRCPASGWKPRLPFMERSPMASTQFGSQAGRVKPSYDQRNSDNVTLAFRWQEQFLFWHNVNSKPSQKGESMVCTLIKLSFQFCYSRSNFKWTSFFNSIFFYIWSRL